MSHSNGTPPSSIGPTAAAALEALQKSRAAAQAKDVIDGKDLTSLNKLLQWSTAHTPTDAAQRSQPGQEQRAKTPAQLATDREWLDAAFPDMFASVRAHVAVLTKSPPPSAEAVEDALLALEELFADLNYAVNIEKLHALQPVLAHCAHDDAAVRTAATWALASALQGLHEVREAVLAREGERVVAAVLRDTEGGVRAKGVMAAAALLKNGGEEVYARFEKAGGVEALREALVDADARVRRKAMFFLEHAEGTGNVRFVEGLLADRKVMGGVASGMGSLNVENVGEVEAMVGGLSVLVERDRQGVLMMAPELPGVVDTLAEKCSDGDLQDKLVALAEKLG